MFEMMYDILGGERDLPYRMTSGKVLKLNSSPSSHQIITKNKKGLFKIGYLPHDGVALWQNANNHKKDANIWFVHRTSNSQFTFVLLRLT